MNGSDFNNKIGVLVVTYNQYELTKKFLQIHKRFFTNNPNLKLLLLDNNSIDQTYSKIKNQFKDVDIRKLNDNYGCVTGRNIGVLELIKSGYEYICILDNDVEIEDYDFFSKLLVFMQDNNQLDGCCPIVRFNETRNIQTAGYIIKKFQIKNVSNINNLKSNYKIDILPGCAQFLRSKAFVKYGFYDNDLSPVSIEDLEWGLRNKKAGISLAYCSNTEVIHHHNIKIKDSISKKEFVIIGRMVFLRKYFNLVNILKEFKHFLLSIKDFGLIFAINAYKKGFNKKILDNNYDYEVFSKKQLSQYYDK